MNDDGQPSSDDHPFPAVGHEGHEHHSNGADDELHALLGHYARLLWDVQKMRVAVNNRAKKMTAPPAYDDEGKPEPWSGHDLPEEHVALHLETCEVLKKQEQAVNRQLERLAKRHIMADWVLEAPGLGLPGFARIIGVTGSFMRFPTVSKVWKYLGLSVDHGEAPKKRKGEKLNYSPQGRVVCHQIGESIVKLNDGRYRVKYDEKKKDYEEFRLDWPQIRRHRAAMRYAVKALIKDLWVEWHKRERATSPLKPRRKVPANAVVETVT